MDNKKQNLVYIFIAVAVAVAIGIYWYFGKDKSPKVETTEEAVEALSITPQVTVETNPVKKVPNLNPVEKINPFKTVNPFQ